MSKRLLTLLWERKNCRNSADRYMKLIAEQPESRDYPMYLERSLAQIKRLTVRITKLQTIQLLKGGEL